MAREPLWIVDRRPNRGQSEVFGHDNDNRWVCFLIGQSSRDIRAQWEVLTGILSACHFEDVLAAKVRI